MLETDYLIVGSGAVGMAFADVLLAETDASMIIVDRYPKPGGHWNVAYPFVSLHQPSHFYGVSSKMLGEGQIDTEGWNQGLYELATGAEISAYFEEVMQETFLPSGRVKYFPSCEYLGNRQFRSLDGGEIQEVVVRKKIVDCTYLKTSVPATHTPNFEVAEGLHFIPINGLPEWQETPETYVIIGGGKTGVDACLWLLEQGVEPDKIQWIVSRDAWMINRQKIQPTMEFFEGTMGAMADQMEAIATAKDPQEIFDRLEEVGLWVRIDPEVRPKMFHAATISELELAQLRRIKNVIRMGRLQHIEKEEMILDQGRIPASPDSLYVDCSATAISNIKAKTIFDGDLITPQTVRPYQPVFSGAFIAHVEAVYGDDKVKNKLCQVVPLPNADTDWVPMVAAQMVNQFTWSQDKPLRKWLAQNRLDGFSGLTRAVDRSDEQKMAILHRMRSHAMPAFLKLQQFMQASQSTATTPMNSPQFQVKRNAFIQQRLVETPPEALTLQPGEIRVEVEKFAYTANNITYAVAGDTIGYWKFFPPVEGNEEIWGVIPVWGFAKVAESSVEGIAVGERIFGYFPPAKAFKMRPVGVKPHGFIDGTEHRADLPPAYNRYTLVAQEPGYNPEFDNERMMLSPLYLTSFCLWDALQDQNWFGAEQVIVLSASSKTSVGLAYAIQADENAPRSIGLTSTRNLSTVEGLGVYGEALAYESATEVPKKPTVIVDMSGNTKVMAELHQHLGEEMKWTLRVGLTHWTDAAPSKGIISERSKFFFAPSHIQKRLKDWGSAGFQQKTAAFMGASFLKTRSWLEVKYLNGLEELAAIHADVCEGKIPAHQGLIVKV